MSIQDSRQDKKTVKSERPWGDVYMVVRNQKCSVDLTHVRPGKRSSLHSHQVRYELFHFLDDGAVLEVNGQTFYPKAHEEYLLRPGDQHRFWAEEKDFRILVVSFGHWEAADQVRHADDYGRTGTPLRL